MKHVEIKKTSISSEKIAQEIISDRSNPIGKIFHAFEIFIEKQNNLFVDFNRELDEIKKVVK